MSAQQIQACFAGGMLRSYSLFCVWSVSISDPTPGCTWVSRRLNRGVFVQGRGMVGDRCPEFTLEKEGWVCVRFGHILCVLLRSFTYSLCFRPDLQGSVIFSCVCVRVSVCVGSGESSQPVSHGGDPVALGSRLPEKIHSSLLVSCFPGFSWGAEEGEFLPGTNPAGQAGC